MNLIFVLTKIIILVIDVTLHIQHILAADRSALVPRSSALIQGQV